MNIGDAQIDAQGLWSEPWTGFRPWYWPILPLALRAYEARVKELIKNLNVPIFEYMGFPKEIVRILPRSTREFIEVKDKRANRFAQDIGVSFNNVIITDLKYRWGSCTPRDNININWKLIKAPMFVIDYVLVHELTHLIEHNHTPRFWGIVRTQVPGYEKAKLWLKEQGAILENDF